MKKYVFIQNEPFLLPKVLGKYLREFAESTAGINIQSISPCPREKISNDFAPQGTACGRLQP